MKLRVLTGAVGAVGMLACVPAAAQAAGCPAPTPGVKTITTVKTVTTPAPTTTTPTMTTTTTSTTATTTTPTTTTPKPTVTKVTTTKKVKTKPVPYRAKLNGVSLSGLFTLKGSQVTVPKRSVAVTVIVHPYVSGERLDFTEKLNGRTFKTVKLAGACTAASQTGTFTLDVSAPGFGQVEVSGHHAADPKLTAVSAKTKFSVLNTSVHVGSTGAFVDLVQERLQALHIFMPQSGVYDEHTQLALDAYHRLLGDGEGDESLDPKTINDLLDGIGSFHVKYPQQGDHAEGDLSDQLLAFINNGDQVYWIFPISSGKPSTPTILGNFQIYYKEPEYTSDGMYFSFFHGGYAIHGYDPAPDYPASHGCMRLPIVDAITAFSWTRVGDWVDTYYT